MLDRRARAGIERGLGPIARGLGRIGVTPDALTVFGLVMSIATAVAVGSGHLVWGVVGIALSGLGDLLDGNLARTSGRTGPRGSFFDSVADRASDAIVLGGVGWYLAGGSEHLSMLAFAVAALSMMISYERAKAEALGLEARGGLMERAERFVFLGVGMAFDVLEPVLWVMLVLCSITVVHRFVKVWIAAGRPVANDVVLRPEVERRSRTRSRAFATRRPLRESRPDSVRFREWWDAHGPAALARGGTDEPATTRRRHPARRRSRAE
jgi:CDP-diacylglycerol---glycerol-3-phosphate 3-phosphatidyltransferase